MIEKDYSPLSSACVRALRDKMPDKRKTAVAEIERMVKDFITVKNHVQIKRIIDIIGNEFINSSNPNSKKGGLMAIATIAIALGSDSQYFIDQIITPALSCFSDYDPSVRYAACESLYNVIKTLRSAILPHFSRIFDSLTRLVSDTDLTIRNAAETLDKSLKDIVTDSSIFDLASFIEIISQQIYSKDQFVKEFIITWISLLDAVSSIDLIPFLPNLLDGLFLMLKDTSTEIRKTCETILGEFRRKILKNPSIVDFKHLINIAIIHAQAKEELLQLTAIIWIKDFIELSKTQMLPHLSGIFSVVLPCLAYNTDFGKEIKETATVINEILMELIVSNVHDNDGDPKNEQIDLNTMIGTLTSHLNHHSVETKVAVLKWIHHLIVHIPIKMSTYNDQFFPALLKKLSDPSNKVVQKNLEVLAEIMSHKNEDQSDFYYGQFVTYLLDLFRTDRKMLELKGSFIIRKLCILLSSEYIYKTLSENLLHENDIKFACVMVEALNLILLTAPELFELRNRLKELKNEECRQLFLCLYKSWSHSPIATVALCLLTTNYVHTYNLIRLFSGMEITVDFLVEIDKLIQLIESPVFAFLRLDLLEHQFDKYLFKSLYGLLMLLPQSDAFCLLKNRLQCVPHCCLNNKELNDEPSKDLFPETLRTIDFQLLINHFKMTQDKHRLSRYVDNEKEFISNLDINDVEDK